MQLEELGELEPAILENQAKLNECDVICYTYDSSDPDSFSHIVELRVCIPVHQATIAMVLTLEQKKYPHLDELPSIYTALKADQDKAMQRCELQPDEYTLSINMPAPLHVSVTWNSISESFVHVRNKTFTPIDLMLRTTRSLKQQFTLQPHFQRMMKNRWIELICT
jgi:Ras family protein T1